MEIQTIDSDTLISNTKILVGKERELTTRVIEHLYEIERRYLFASRGYSSMYEFCIKELKYSEGAAHRRIAAMRLVKVVPQTKEFVQTGKLTLTQASAVQGFFNNERKINKKEYSPSQKLKVIESVCGQSKRDTEKTLLKISPNAILAKNDKTRTMTAAGDTRISFTADNELMQKLKRVKELAAHKLNGSESYADIIKLLADKFIKENDPNLKPPLQKAPKTNLTKVTNFTSPESYKQKSTSQTRYIPQKVKQEVWHRDDGKCTYRDPKTKHQCHSKYGLEYEHLIPFSHGGPSTTDNLTLRCRTHNKLAALKYFERKF